MIAALDLDYEVVPSAREESLDLAAMPEEVDDGVLEALLEVGRDPVAADHPERDELVIGEAPSALERLGRA